MKIKELRQASNLLQQDVANAMNVDRSTVSCWERGIAFPTAKQLPALADLFHCSIDALFGRDTA